MGVEEQYEAEVGDVDVDVDVVLPTEVGVYVVVCEVLNLDVDFVLDVVVVRLDVVDCRPEDGFTVELVVGSTVVEDVKGEVPRLELVAELDCCGSTVDVVAAEEAVVVLGELPPLSELDVCWVVVWMLVGWFPFVAEDVVSEEGVEDDTITVEEVVTVEVVVDVPMVDDAPVLLVSEGLLPLSANSI